MRLFILLVGCFASLTRSHLVPSSRPKEDINNLKFEFLNSSDVLARQHLSDQDEVRFIGIGDWGSGRSHQKEVAEAIGQWCDSKECDFMLSVGDNFYTTGVDSIYDKKFDKIWRNVYTQPSISNLPWYLTVGNHDHGQSKEWNQVHFSQIEPRWHMPALAFSFRISTKSANVTFVSIDTISITDDKNDADRMIGLLDSTLRDAPESDWKIVFGHFPCHSGGHYGGSKEIREKVLPIMKEHKVDMYLAGHDHNLQHWKEAGLFAKGIDHVVIGAGGESEYRKYNHNVRANEALGMRLEYFWEHYGFSYFSVTENTITVDFVDKDGRQIHQFTRTRA